MSLEEFSFAPINLGIWDVVHDRYPFKENDEIGILERLALRYKELNKVADVEISHKTSYEELGKVDGFIWKMWTCIKNQDQVKECDGDENDDKFEEEEVNRISGKYLELDISSAALNFLLRLMYTGQYDGPLSVGIELLDKAKKLSLDFTIIKVVTANLISKMNLELLKDWWMNPTCDSVSILQSPSFMDLSVAFIISHPQEIFTFDVVASKIGIDLPRKVMECLLPNNLQRDLEKYKKFESENWQCKINAGPGGNYYLDMAHDRIAEHLFHWALMRIKKSRPLKDMISVNDIQKELGDLTQLLNKAEFANFLQDYEDKDGIPVFSTMGSHYFFAVAGSKCRDENYRNNLPAVSFDYEKSQPSSEQFDLGYSSTQDEPQSSQSSDTSTSQPPRKRFKYRNAKSTNPLIKQLEKAFNVKEISDVYFQVSTSTPRITTSSFLLSLQCEKFFYYFKCNSMLFHDFYLGRVPLETAKDFLRLFHSVSLPPSDTLLDCMKLSRHLEINSFMSRGYMSVITMPLTVENVTLQYCMEFNCGDPTRAMEVLVPFMKRHLPLILNSEFVGTFETKDLITHLLSMERSPKLEIGAILAASRWLRYNFVKRDDPIYDRLVEDLNFKKLSLGDLHKLLDDNFIKTQHEVVDLAFKLGGRLAK